MDDRIRQGRDPEWRPAAQDRLGDATRGRLRQAVRRGGSLADPDEAAIAAGLARRQQRMLLLQAWIVLPLQVGLTLTWLAMLPPPAQLPTAFRWFWAAVLTLLVCVAPLVLWHRT